ncbi:MAG: NADH:ubiquinone oxidoreductase subunit NDUFA12 [Pseudomonadota bacterium]
MSLLAQLFTWWNGQTLGTRIWTARKGERVGEDEQGNVFYRSADGKRRWVIYAGEAEASRISPDWHGWLHHTFQEPPTERPLARKAWEKPHQPNLTGTAQAYHPPGSLYAPDPKPRSDYDAWAPE